MEYLWKITICGIIYGVVLIFAGEGSGAEVTRVACACGMLLTVLGTSPGIDGYKGLVMSGLDSVRSGVEQGQVMAQSDTKTQQEAALAQLTKEQIASIADVQVAVTLRQDSVAIQSVQVSVGALSAEQKGKIIAICSQSLGIEKERVVLIEK